MKTCVIGAGALGSVIGGVLADSGIEVTLVSRNRAHVAAIARDGLLLRTDAGDRRVTVRAAVDTSEVDCADLVIVLVKSLQTRAAIEAARNIVDSRTTVVSLQNGLGHEDVLGAAVGVERVIAGKTWVGGDLLGPGHVLAGWAGKETIIGELDGSRSKRVTAIADMFTAAGLQTTVSENIHGVIWDKLLVNVATGALSAITRLAYGDLNTVPEVEACGVAAVGEAMAVARAKGIDLATQAPGDAWRAASRGLPRDFKTSMLQSLERGRRTEIDFINGAVVRAGMEYGVPTPVNQALVACVRGIERRMAGSTTATGE